MAKAYKNPGAIEFSAIIQADKDGAAGWVDFPYDLRETYGQGNLVPITAIFDGRVTYQGSLAKRGGPHAMILLRKDVRSQLGKVAGELVHIHVELDDKPRQLAVAEDVQGALRDASLWEYFQELAYTHRREYVEWIEGAKKPETRTARIQKMLTMLQSKNR